MARLPPPSLTVRLVVTAVALVALVSVLIAVATTLAVRSHLNGRLDDDVRRSHDRAVQAVRLGMPRAALPRRGRPPFGEARGQDERTVTAYLTADVRSGFLLTPEGGRTALSGTVLDELEAVPADGSPHPVDLDALGGYRAVARQVGEVTVVTGLPTEAVAATVGSLVGAEVLFTSFGLVAAGAWAWVAVRRQLRPLRDVARTAHEVAALPLAEGAVGVTRRVPVGLTDERTEVGQVGSALNGLLGHMEQALDERHRSEQQVRRFVADASHELRTPLATIQGYAELSRRLPEPRPAAAMAEALGKVEREAARMSSLVEDLLLLARLDAGRPLAREEVDLSRLVVESTADARVVAPDHGWTLELTQEPVVVIGDEQRLRQVVTNLVGNAGRHTPPGTTVTVGVHADERQATVTVRDDGPGLPEDLAGTVFERFSRGDTARTRDSGGSGLGLSIARAISAAHGGELSVDSTPGATTFALTLPAAGPATGPAPYS